MKFICKLCNKEFKNENVMKVHIRSDHMLPKIGLDTSFERLEWQIAAPNEYGQFKCFDCTEIFSSIPSAKVHHKKVHRKEDKFTCKVCSKGFKKEDDMKLHMQNNHMLPRKARGKYFLICSHISIVKLGKDFEKWRDWN